MVSLEPAREPIGTENTKIFTVFHGIWHFRGARGGRLEKVNSGVDRARRVLLGASDVFI
jgi:hypothetical protein